MELIKNNSDKIKTGFLTKYSQLSENEKKNIPENIQIQITNKFTNKLFEPGRIVDFIRLIYDKLIESDMCFLSGAFVFEDPNLELFNTLISSDDISNNDIDLKRNGIFTSTHNVFFNAKTFKERLTSKSSDYLLNNTFHKIFNTLPNGKNNLQYQRVLDVYLSYLCDKCCQKQTLKENNTNNVISESVNTTSNNSDNNSDNSSNIRKSINKINDISNNVSSNVSNNVSNNKTSSNKDCTPTYCKKNKETKRILLFYPFQIEKQDGSDKHTYLYLKLENNLAQSLYHQKRAMDRYVLFRSKKHTHKSRREDNRKNKQKFYNSNSKNTKLFKKLYNKTDNNHNNSNLDSIKFYNKFVRSSNELFLSKNMINKILS